MISYLAKALSDVTVSESDRANTFELLVDSVEVSRVIKESKDLVRLKLFIDLEQYFSLKLKVDILNFTIHWLSGVKLQSLESTTDEAYTFKRRMCQFLYSIVQQLCHHGNHPSDVEDIKTIMKLSRSIDSEDSHNIALLSNNTLLLQAVLFFEQLHALKLPQVVVFLLK